MSGLVVFSSVPVLAQSGKSSGSVIEEVVVTAQKRQQSISDVGMSITARSGEQLQELGIGDVAGLMKVEPSFMVSQASYGTPVYSIRGVGYNSESLAASPTVSVYVDEVAFAFPALTKGATLDLERVEILKGPQGTLYGQNATGGAINYIAAKPTSTFEAGIEGTYARFDAINVNGFVSGPLTDTLGARFAFDVSDGGAWQESFTHGGELGDTRQQKLRLLLSWAPTDRLDVAVNLNTWTDESDTPVTQLIDLNLQDPTQADQVPDLVNAPFAPNDARAANWFPGLPHENDQQFYQATVRADYEVSDGLTLTSLSSIQDYEQDDWINNDGVAVDGNSQRQRGTVESFSQEFRASGVAVQSRMAWLLGVTYAKDETEENSLGRLPYTTPAFAFTAFGLEPFAEINTYAQPTATTKAVFGNIEFDLLDNLNLQAGARYTKSEIDYEGCLSGDAEFTAGMNFIQGFVKGDDAEPVAPGECLTFDSTFTPGMVNSSLNEDNVSWRLGLNWHPLENTLLYTTVSKGFKAGSFPTLPGTGEVQFEPVKQEELLSYEVGVKSTVTPQFVVNGAVFKYDYKDKQLRGRILDPAQVFGVIDALVNIPDSSAQGAELEMIWMPVQGLRLNLAATYLDAEVDGDFFTIDIYETGSDATNYDGYSFPSTPEWTVVAGARYEWPLKDNLLAFVGADYRYQTEAPSLFQDRATIGEHPSLESDEYGLLDLRVGVATADGRWTVQLFSHNALDEYYATHENRIYDTSVRYAGKPVTYGIKVAYRFE
ncbi:TonB-dependent receptor [Spongiibacter taiwanensis]|uniref:TonB-dependent receptor n=1 Tax=Spongiibacter taiwanensis TaxID=1748242 RepID=UPI00203648E3|nr:TonB-dependent receptor [Spongiibacter taiwanensis]USA44796.1 TonB-dependent receptor [Spongiibacter taiwanensis]